jgi:hypothetical protein
MSQTRNPNKSNAVDLPGTVPIPVPRSCSCPVYHSLLFLLPHRDNQIHANLVSPRLPTILVPMSNTYIHPVFRKKVTGVPCAPVLPWRWRCGGEEPNNDFPLLRNASNASGVGEIYI